MEGGNVLHHVEKESGELSGKGEYLGWGNMSRGKMSGSRRLIRYLGITTRRQSYTFDLTAFSDRPC